MEDEIALAKLNALKQDRKNLKSKFTRFITYYTTHNELDQIRLRLNAVENSLDEFVRIQSAINLVEVDPNSDAEIEKFEIDYFEHISNARAKVKERDEVASDTTIRDSQIRTPCESVGNHIEINNTKLPPLELKKFAGNPDGWLTFCDSFKSAVHNNGRLTDFDKLRYLQAHLTGSALKVIDSVETTAANYEVAWKLLEEQYDNRRIIIQTHIKCLMEMPSIAKEGSYGMNDLLNDVLIRMRALKSLGQPVESWDAILIYIITSRLDRFTHLEWEKSLSDSEIPSFESLRKFIKQRYNSLNVVKTQTNPSKNISKFKWIFR